VQLALQAAYVGILAPLSAHADQRELQQPRAAVDAVLLVDASGSMLKTDAQMLRYEGAKLFLQFLGKDDRFALVSFADKANVVSELKEFSKEPADEVVKKINSIKTEGQYSDILEGIRAAERILEASPRNDAEQIIILLSDGKMEPNPSVGLPSTRTLELVNQALPELKAKEIKVHSLAFSDQADKMLLAEISAATDGLNWYTKNSDQVHKSFANLFLAVKRPQVLPMRSRSFILDDDVSEATFYITREEGTKLTLISPKNQEMTVDKIPEWVTWFAGKNFDVITMREPDVGEWQVQGGVSAEGFATVLTNLKLVTDWPVIVRVDDKNVVQARLYDGEKPVALPEMSGVVQYAFQVMPTDRIAAAVAQDFLNDEGRDGDRVAHDGIFSKYCTISEVGEYKISIVARGPTFERTQQVPFRVRPRLVNLEILSTHNAEEADAHSEHADAHDSTKSHGADSHVDSNSSHILKGDQTFVMRSDLSQEALSFRDLEVQVEAVSQDRRKTVLQLKRRSSEGLRYEALTAGLPEDGMYSLKAVLKGVSKKGQEIEAESPVIKFELKSTVKRADPTPVVVQKEAPVQPKHEEKFPVLPIAVGSLASIIAMIVGVILTKKPKSTAGASVRYNPPKQMLDAIASLEERLVSSEIKIGDVELESEAEAEKGDVKESDRLEPTASPVETQSSSGEV
jgi:hypothetical protein